MMIHVRRFVLIAAALLVNITAVIAQHRDVLSHTDNAPYVVTFLPDVHDGYAHALDSEKLTRPVCAAVSNFDSAEYIIDHEIIEYENYAVCYRESYEQPEWVSYVLTAQEVCGTAPRDNDFRSDTRITTGSAEPGDYTKSGYDRGHLAPAADMKMSANSMSESFYMTNMSPQSPSFNRGIWSKLEQHVRDLALTYGAVAVVSGPILEKTDYPVIGEHEVAVPEYFYKVLLAVNSDGTIQCGGYILPNKKAEHPLSFYACSIDDVEKRTNIDFFAFLPDANEDIAEACTCSF